jgi:hypothetical protein
MRVLSLGFPLPSPSIDNYSFLTAPAFFDYDVLVVDPRRISELIEDITSRDGEYTTFAGERVVNEPTSGVDGVALAELLHNRADETARLLSRGGLVVCLAIPNATHHGVVGYAEFDRYAWLPCPGNLVYRPPFLNRASGTQFARLDLDHPFASALHKIAGRLAYQVYFDDDSSAFDGQVIARSMGGAAVSADLAIGGGRVIFIPPPARALDSQHRYQAAEALQEAMRNVLRVSSQSAAPWWISECDMPGLSALRSAYDQASDNVATARESLAVAARELERLTLYQGLLWQEGHAFDEAVRAALMLLGFTVTPKDLDMPTGIEWNERGPSPRKALLDTQASEEAVSLDVHYRMRRRLEDALANGTPQRGVVVVNGLRRTPPVERGQQFTDQLRDTSDQLGYCLATGEQLFGVVCASLRGDRSVVDQFCERLLVTNGPIPGD